MSWESKGCGPGGGAELTRGNRSGPAISYKGLLKPASQVSESKVSLCDTWCHSTALCLTDRAGKHLVRAFLPLRDPAFGVHLYPRR